MRIGDSEDGGSRKKKKKKKRKIKKKETLFRCTIVRHAEKCRS